MYVPCTRVLNVPIISVCILQIPSFTFGTVSKLLSSMLSRVNSRVLPKCEARITNTGSTEKLKYSISVRPSRPRVSYELTSDVLYKVTDTEKSMTPLPG